MRTRAEILRDFPMEYEAQGYLAGRDSPFCGQDRHASRESTRERLLLEVLLDIRDMLAGETP